MKGVLIALEVVVTLVLEVMDTIELRVVGPVELRVVGPVELRVDGATLLNWIVVDAIVEGVGFITIDEIIIAPVDEIEMVVADIAIPDNVMPLADGVGIVRPTLDMATVSIKHLTEFEWLLQLR